MIQIKKTILTLVALLAVTTGAWALDPNAVTAAEINSDLYSGWSSLDERMLKASDLPGFQAVTENQAKSWTGVPSTGRVILFYDFVADGNVKVVIFKNGVYDSSYEVEDLRCYDIYEDIEYDGETKFFYTTGPAPSAPSGPKVAWDKAEKTGKFTMPGGNVTLEPEYFPQAALTAAPTAINDVPATTDGAIVKAGTVANIGSTETAQGTVMYYVSQTALDDAALLALAADQWTADVPTAAKLTNGQAYVYYYVRGNDSDTDEENFSDGDILAANALTVTIAAEPTYAVTFAEGTDPNEWSASPNADVKKGQTVTVTYTGQRKVMGVKAEKKAAAGIINPVVGQIIGSDGNNYAANATLPDGVTKVAMIAYVSGSNGLALALTDEGIYTWDNSSPSNNGKTAPEICSALNTSKPVTGGTWKLPSRDEWIQMFSANGGNEGSCTGLNTAIGNAGGTALQENEEYWSSSEVDEWDAWLMYLEDGNASWSDYGKHYSRCVRACLVF